MTLGDLDIEHCFSDGYDEARGKFIAAAGAAGGVITSLVNPEALGPAGGTLALDAARFGPREAEKAVLFISGTHGPEAFAGSAIQIAWLERHRDRAFAPDVAVFVVHGLNPYGFAHITRTTEHYVDLNRNFVDFTARLPENPLYRAIEPHYALPRWDEDTRRAAWEARDAFIAEHGMPTWLGAFSQGQYEEPRGLTYGGRWRQWSNLALERLLREQIPAARRIGMIDWHTGLGAYGEPFFLCFNAPGTALWDRCATWWGADRIGSSAGFDGGTRPKYSGLVFQGVETFVAPAELAGGVVELGTGPVLEMLETMGIEHWLRYGERPADPAEVARWHRKIKDACCPPDPDWRRSAIRHGLEIQEACVAGVGAW